MIFGARQLQRQQTTIAFDKRKREKIVRRKIWWNMKNENRMSFHFLHKHSPQYFQTTTSFWQWFVDNHTACNVIYGLYYFSFILYIHFFCSLRVFRKRESLWAHFLQQKRCRLKTMPNRKIKFRILCECALAFFLCLHFRKDFLSARLTCTHKRKRKRQRAQANQRK